ncbi:toprim domain-containing protein [Pontibacter liquoris]|uniref:toprim domain-containing protein n=1 Tax=Pontibacter liquoris TaxID=2905677 RepID=UPI001FA7ADA5|nr:toprim domain-containing protein [Pontibacter liquoris]
MQNKANNRMTCQQARERDLVDYLAALGFAPARVRHNDYWYCSPLREEKNPSFKINRALNRWYDHGLGKGGNALDFALLFHKCTLRAFLQGDVGGDFQHLPQRATPALPAPGPQAGKITILRQGPLTAASLPGRYLARSGISPATAQAYCRHVTYSLYGKVYESVGFANDAGGYELRTPAFKASSSPKAISTFARGAREVAVFEGFIDFLSYLEIHKNRLPDPPDFLVLNSVSFFETARPFLERHAVIRLFLDNDATGRQYSRQALAYSARYRDESHRYPHHKDLNDWLVHQAGRQRLATRLRPA